MTNKTIEAVDEKAVAVVEKRITKAEVYAADLVVETDEQQTAATKALSELNIIGDTITEQKEELTKPLNAVLGAIRARYKPLETAHANAVKIIKGKLGAYYNKKEAAARLEAEKIAARAAKGTIKPETAVRKLEAIAPVATNVKTDEGTVQYKKVYVATITKRLADIADADILTLHKAGLLEWNETAEKKAAIATGREGEVLTGVVVTVETRIANLR